ncbi:hypothetical protein WAI453_008175 [Rhynchosporium graminicola]
MTLSDRRGQSQPSHISLLACHLAPSVGDLLKVRRGMDGWMDGWMLSHVSSVFACLLAWWLCLAHGAWGMEHGAWGMGHGAWAWTMVSQMVRLSVRRPDLSGPHGFFSVVLLKRMGHGFWLKEGSIKPSNSQSVFGRKYQGELG